MRIPGDAEALGRLLLDNPWRTGAPLDPAAIAYPRRAFFDAFLARLDRPGLTVLAGPRRVGKTVLVRQALARLLDTGMPPERLAYADLAAPAVESLPMPRLATLFGLAEGPGVLALDGVHRRPGWEGEAAALVRDCPELTLVAVSALRPATGPAFVLPPLTFCEHLRLSGSENELIETMVFGRTAMYVVRDLPALNRSFLAYLNTGGFPETLLLKPQHGDAGQHLRGAVLEAVLGSDLPARLGVGSTAELAALFTLLARNTGHETAIEPLAETTGLAKNTVRRYLDVLEGAMLIRRMPRLHPEGERFRRMRSFKVHLTIPSLHAALFGPVTAADAAYPALAESAVIGQWLGSQELPRLHFARLPEGPVDLIALDPADDRPAWACRLAGSDNAAEAATAALVRFARKNAPLRWIGATTNTVAALRVHDGIEVWHRPTAQYAYEIGRRTADDARKTTKAQA